MRYLGVFIIIFVLTVGLLAAPTASAATISASGEIKIIARVADTHYVIVDSQDKIIEITSNTNKDVTPRVFRGSITTDSEIALTDKIYGNYRQIVPAGQSRIGILYKKSEEPGKVFSLWQRYILNSPASSLNIFTPVFLR